jgi:hypothetical protein
MLDVVRRRRLDFDVGVQKVFAPKAARKLRRNGVVPVRHRSKLRVGKNQRHAEPIPSVGAGPLCLEIACFHCECGHHSGLAGVSTKRVQVVEKGERTRRTRIEASAQ